MEHEQEGCQVAKPNEDKPVEITETPDEGGIYISDQEMQDLGEFLGVIQQYLLAHEARIGALEEVIHEMFKGQHETELDAALADWDSEGGSVDEPTDDSPEG